MDLVIATLNKKKLIEIKDLLNNLDFNILSMDDFPDIPEVIEDSDTFEGNAVKKAVEIACMTRKLTLADDSGLEIDCLGGEPGVRSARYAGEKATDEDRNRKVLELLNDVPKEKRAARFRCVIAIANPDGDVQTVEGVCEGEIAFGLLGNEGFGYDPIFLVPSYGKTFAELGPEIKNQISHRAIALRKARNLLANFGSI